MNLDHGDNGGARHGWNGDAVLLDLSKINSIRSLDPEGTHGLLRKVVEFYIEKSPELIEQITTALVTGDGEVVFRAAHSLKSSSATIGAMGLSETCRQLEASGRSGNLDGAMELSERMKSEFHQVCMALTRMIEGV